MRTPTSITMLHTSCAASMQRAVQRNWQLLFVDYAAAHTCDAFNLVQRTVQRTWSTAVQVDGTVHWVCTDTGMMASRATALQQVGWRWTSVAIKPTAALVRAYVQACRMVDDHRANRWWMLGALIGLRAENCTTVAGRLIGKHTAWPDQLRNIAEKINT